MVDACAEAASSLLEQIKFDVSNETLTTLQAIVYGLKSNLATVIANQGDRDALLASLGGFRKAFVTSRRSKEDLRNSITAICRAVTENHGLMRLLRERAKPLIAKHRAIAKAEAKAAARAKASFKEHLKQIARGQVIY